MQTVPITVEYVDHMGSDLSVTNAARVCRQRLDATAQEATREVAAGIQDMVEPRSPVSWAALME